MLSLRSNSELKEDVTLSLFRLLAITRISRTDDERTVKRDLEIICAT